MFCCLQYRVFVDVAALLGCVGVVGGVNAISVSIINNVISFHEAMRVCLYLPQLFGSWTIKANVGVNVVSNGVEGEAEVELDVEVEVEVEIKVKVKVEVEADSEADSAKRFKRVKRVKRVKKGAIVKVFIENANVFAVHAACSTKDILRCGDIESNPGPIPQLQPQPQPFRSDGQSSGQDGASSTVKPSKSQLQVITQNVRGLGDSKKVRHLVNSCYKLAKNSQDSIFLFQETYVAKLELLHFLWRGEFQLTMGTGNSLGCITLLTAPYKILRCIELGQRGHILVVTKNEINKADLIVANVYAPNGFDADKLRFFEELFDTLEDVAGNYMCNRLILAGDLNLVFNQREVSNRVLGAPEQRIASAVKIRMQGLDMIDGWTDATKPSFTWTSSRTGQQAFSTLDRIIFTRNGFLFEECHADWSLSISDHAAVMATFKSPNVQNKSSLISRLDPRLLDDPEGKAKLDEVFLELISQSSPDWNPHVSLEYSKMCIRTAANTANGMIKARYRDDEANLNKDINLVIDELSSDSSLSADRKRLLMHKLDDLRMLKRRLVDKIGARLEQKTQRKWYNEGELSNKYFFNLLNRRSNEDIKVIVGNDGNEISDETLIAAEIKHFYKDLYEKVPDEIEIDDDLFRNVESLDPQAADEAARMITITELEETLRSCSDSAPGPDGIPYSYLKHFWQHIGEKILNSWAYSIATSQLPPSHKVSYLKLIPKAGKDIRLINNLRPITLSNTDHKLITKTYAKKLTAVVAGKICEEQTAYIPNRLINDNIRSMLMTIDLANLDQAVDGILISLDAKKAFDSVDHRYIRKCLEAFGLINFIPIFDTLYRGLSSDIILNGKVMKGYQILKGVKQGDALSCILFIICMEPLLRNLNDNDVIERLSSPHLDVVIPKSYGYADDVTVVTKNSERCVQEVFREYEKFSKASGLILNAEKTEILGFNHRRIVNDAYQVVYRGNRFEIRSVSRIKVNGIILLQDTDQREEENVVKVLGAIERLLRSWSTRRLTLLGKILIIKTYAMSQAIYLMQTMSLSSNNLKKIMTLIFKYLWNRNFDALKAPERIRRSIMFTPIKHGGYGLVDIKDLGDSLDLKAYGRLHITRHPLLSQLKGLLSTGFFFKVEIRGAVDLKLRRAITMLNEDRCKVLKWSTESIVRCTILSQNLLNTKLVDLLNPMGRQSIHYLAIHRRARHPRIRQLNSRELASVTRFIVVKYQPLIAALNSLVSAVNNHNVQVDILGAVAYPTNEEVLTNISNLTSKGIRCLRANDDLNCIFKLGPVLTPGELLSWTNSVRRLTSTRHKNILLRTMHGDIFSNSRLFKFRLRESPTCANCDEAIETVQHRLFECPNAVASWEKLEEFKLRLNLNLLTDLSIENLVGAKDGLSKLELALQAELMLRLSTKSDGYCPTQLVRSAVLMVGNSEKLDQDTKQRFDSIKRER